MAQQQGLAFTSGGEAQERLGSPAEPAKTHHSGGQDRPASSRAFEQLRRLSSTQLEHKAAAGGGVTSRQAIFPLQVQSALQTMTVKRRLSVYGLRSAVLVANASLLLACRVLKTGKVPRTALMMSGLCSLIRS